MKLDRRLLLLLAAVGAASVVAIVLIIVGTGGGSSGSGSTPVTTTSAARSFLTGVPQHGNTLGKPGAPAMLVVFEDPQCPFCREWSLGALPTVVDQFVKTGRVKLLWRGIAIIGPNSVAGLRAAYAAARQDRLWNMVDALYERQGSENSGWITTTLLREAAAAAGVKAAPMLALAPSAAITAELKEAVREARKDKVEGTPTFILERPAAVPVQLRVTSLEASSFASTLAGALR